MKVYYKVIHLFFTKQPDHIHHFDIGVFDSKQKAIDTVQNLKFKEGFCERPEKFYIFKILCFKEPELLNQTYWVDGFTTYTK